MKVIWRRCANEALTVSHIVLTDEGTAANSPQHPHKQLYAMTAACVPCTPRTKKARRMSRLGRSGKGRRSGGFRTLATYYTISAAAALSAAPVRRSPTKAGNGRVGHLPDEVPYALTSASALLGGRRPVERVPPMGIKAGLCGHGSLGTANGVVVMP